MAEQLYRQRFGDRKDGRLLRSLSPNERLTPYLVPRGDAGRYFSDSLELDGIEEWLRAKREENLRGLGMLHLLIAAYVRAVAACPGLNRFVSGQKIYARTGIEVVLAVKRGQTGQDEEATVKAVFSPGDTIYDVYRKLGERVDELRAAQSRDGLTRLAGVLGALPGPLAKFSVWLLNFMDYFGWLPQSFLDASPYHGSMMLTDPGAQGGAPVSRCLGSFGNLPVLIAMGGRRRAFAPDASGAMVERQYIDYSVVMDGRIADGVYCAEAFRYMKHCLSHPALLELPPERVAEDVF